MRAGRREPIRDAPVASGSRQNNPADRIAYCDSSSELSDKADESEEFVRRRSRVESESESKIEFEEDYVSQVNQNLFVLEVTLNNLEDTAGFVTNKVIFKDKLNSCKQKFLNLLRTFDLTG